MSVMVWLAITFLTLVPVSEAEMGWTMGWTNPNMSLATELLSCFHSLIHALLATVHVELACLSCAERFFEAALKAGAFAKVKESQRMSDEGKMNQDEADGIRKRCRTVGFALQAEMNHFHRRREVDFKDMMQAYLRQQITFYQRVVQQLERTLHMYDSL